MKKELAGIEIKYLLEEFKVLEDARVDKVFQSSKKDLIIQFHVPNVGKQMLRILSKFVYLSSTKPESPKKMLGFCEHIRKNLESARLRKITQIGSERILELLFETKEKKYRMIIELFAKGNVIFCDENYNILLLIESEKTKGRVLRGGVQYEFPESKQNVFTLELSELKKIIEDSEENISKTIATKLGLGGTYASEACTIAGIDPKASELDTKQMRELYDAIGDLSRRKPNANIVYKEEVIKDIVPIELKVYGDLKKDHLDSFNKALDTVFSKIVKLEAELKKTAGYEKEAEKLKKAISIQEKSMKKLTISAKENQHKGELVYEKYQLVKEILTEIKKAREKYSWKEIKKKVKGHKMIKGIDEKTGEITVEI
jgi:predicted ribosome quality control (RQC) complex YloA/Tae2 family protein